MVGNEKINSYQFFVIVFVFCIGNTIINAPSIIVSYARQDAWISSILALVFGFFLLLLFCKICEKFPRKNIITYSEIVFGKFFGKVSSMFLIIYFFILASLMLRQLSTFVITFLLPETPRIAIDLLFMAVLLMGVFLGIESIVRTAEIFFPVLVLLLLFLIISLSPELEILNIKPIYENGLKPILRGTLVFISIPYLQLIALLMIMPYVNNFKKAKRAFILGVVLAGVFLIINVLYCLLVLGVTLTEYKQYPVYFLAQKISIAEIIERVEVIIAFLWFITIYFKTCIFFYATNLGIVQIFELKDKKVLLLPLGFLMLVLTQFIIPNSVYFNMFFKEIMPFYGLTFGLLFPSLLLCVYFLRKNKITNKEEVSTS